MSPQWVSGFPFNDLHSFKDFITFVAMCSPDQFPVRKGVPATEQWSLDLAFDGLNEGLALARRQAVSPTVVWECQTLFQQALGHYRAGRMREGFQALEKARRVFGRIRTE